MEQRAERDTPKICVELVNTFLLKTSEGKGNMNSSARCRSKPRAAYGYLPEWRMSIPPQCIRVIRVAWRSVPFQEHTCVSTLVDILMRYDDTLQSCSTCIQHGVATPLTRVVCHAHKSRPYPSGQRLSMLNQCSVHPVPGACSRHVSRRMIAAGRGGQASNGL